MKLSSYFSHDAFRLNSDTLYSYNNNIVSARWRHSFTNRHFALFNLYNSHFGYDMSSENPVNEAFILSHRINSTGLKADFNLYTGSHEIRYGLEMTNHSVLPGRFLPLGDSSLVKDKNIPYEQALESASIY